MGKSQIYLANRETGKTLAVVALGLLVGSCNKQLNRKLVILVTVFERDEKVWCFTTLWYSDFKNGKNINL